MNNVNAIALEFKINRGEDPSDSYNTLGKPFVESVKKFINGMFSVDTHSAKISHSDDRFDYYNIVISQVF